MKYTILSAQESRLLENLIVTYGEIVTTDNIFLVAKEIWNEKLIYAVITRLAKHGWLIRIKRGLYAISNLSTRGSLSLSSYVVANLLVKNSYVSFESAIQYYGMFDQLIRKVVSISLTMYKRVLLNNIEYSFVRTKTDYHFGWQEVMIDNRIVRIATAEKALVDMIHFHKSTYSIDLVIEKLREHKDTLDFVKLNEYIGKMSMTTVKIFGFMFDLLHIESSQLLKQAERSNGAHRMVAGAKKFNAKWRLYYDEHFDTYQNL